MKRGEWKSLGTQEKCEYLREFSSNGPFGSGIVFVGVLSVLMGVSVAAPVVLPVGDVLDYAGALMVVGSWLFWIGVGALIVSTAWYLWREHRFAKRAGVR